MKRVAFFALGVFSLVACAKDPGISGVGGNNGGTGPSAGSSGTGGSSGSGPPRTLPGTGGAGTFWPDGGGPVSVDARNCGQATFNLEKAPGEVLLVLDRSGSMQMSVPGSLTSKWVDITGGLNEVLMKTDTTVLWGLKMFPNVGSCAVDDGALVPSALGNYAALNTAITMTTPNGNGTPTTLAIRKATAYLLTVTSRNPKYIVLATDGEPNCGNGVGGARDPVNAVQAVRDAATAGFPTFVVGIAADTIADGVLSEMAVAGMQPRAGTPPYYPVSSRQDFINALGNIAGQVASCVFPLTKAPPENDDVTVEINGMKIMRDTTHMQGWDYGAGKKSIQLYGAICDQLKLGTNDKVAITYGCFIL